MIATVPSPIGGGQHDPRGPHVLLRAVAVCHDGFEAITFSGGDFDDDPGDEMTQGHISPWSLGVEIIPTGATGPPGPLVLRG